MESSLHHQLKTLYAGSEGLVEAVRGRYRIDAVRAPASNGEVLVEIQHSGLAAIRDKIQRLLERSRVLVVKPIVVVKRIERLASADGPVLSVRRSPKRGRAIDLFDELIHFTRVFPHERLAIETPLCEIAEARYPGHGRRRRRRKTDTQIADQRLVSVLATRRFEIATDLLELLPSQLPTPFSTADLVSWLDVRRQAAQRIAYCLRHTGAATLAGKRGNALLYQPRAENE